MKEKRIALCVIDELGNVEKTCPTPFRWTDSFEKDIEDCDDSSVDELDRQKASLFMQAVIPSITPEMIKELLG